MIRRLGILAAVLTCCLAVAAHAASTTSKAELWTALGGNLGCGAAIHSPGKPVTQIICSDIRIPAPKNEGPADGDPGFVFLGSSGRPVLARTSQDTFAGTGNPVKLPRGNDLASRRGQRDLHDQRAVRSLRERRASRLHDHEALVRLVLSRDGGVVSTSR